MLGAKDKEGWLNMRESVKKGKWNMRWVALRAGIVTYYENCKKVLLESQKSEKKISMALIEENFNTTVINDLKEMKFILPGNFVKKIICTAEFI